MNNTITESQLVDYAKNGAVRFLTIVPVSDRKAFNLLVQLTWKEGDLLLLTQQKKPREWVSLDRLYKHIENHYQKVSKIQIMLVNGDTAIAKQLQQD